MFITINLRRKLRSLYRALPIKLSFIYNLYFKIRKIRDRDRVVVKTIDGIAYELHLNEFIDSEVYYYGCFEEDTTRTIKSIVRAGMTVLDIGANIGVHTLPMAKKVGAQGQVIAFEPMAWAQKKLRTNIGLNSFTNIVVEKIALSNKTNTGPAGFRTSWDKYESTSDGVVPEEAVAFDRLDNYVENHNLSTVDFIKLDVDGFECKVLEGAVETLKRFKPTLSMELGNWTLEKQGDTIEALTTLLDSLGYKFFREADFVELSSLDAINREFPDPSTWTINVIVAHSSKVQQLELSGLTWKKGKA